MSTILTKLAAYTAATMNKSALSADYVAQMMYKSPTHKKEIYDIATKALNRTHNTVLPKHPLVEKKLTNAFVEAMDKLDGMVYPVVKKAGLEKVAISPDAYAKAYRSRLEKLMPAARKAYDLNMNNIDTLPGTKTILDIAKKLRASSAEVRGATDRKWSHLHKKLISIRDGRMFDEGGKAYNSYHGFDL